MLQSGPNATGQGVPVSLPMENQNPTSQSQAQSQSESESESQLHPLVRAWPPTAQGLWVLRQRQVNGRAEIWDLESGIRDSGFGGPVSNEQEHK